MRILSDALPIQFWPYANQTYNEQQYAFADTIPFYQQFGIGDSIKLQLVDTDASKEYLLLITDLDNNLIVPLAFAHVSDYRQLSFTSGALDTPVVDQCVRFYIAEQVGTFDLTFDFTFQDFNNTIIYKSDAINFSSDIPFNSSWGTKVIGYKGIKNFAGIRYPNDDTYFYLRVPCQFFRQRPKMVQESLPLSGNQVIDTFVGKGLQQLMKVIYMPDYMHNKLQLVFQHAASGTVLIDGKVWAFEEGYELSIPDEKSPMQMAKIWLSDSNYSIRNSI